MPRTLAPEAGVPRNAADRQHDDRIDLTEADGAELDLTASLPRALDPIASELTSAAAHWVELGADAVVVETDSSECVLAGTWAGDNGRASLVTALSPGVRLRVAGSGPDVTQVEVVSLALAQVLRLSSEVRHVTDELVERDHQMVALRELLTASDDVFDRTALAERLADDLVRLAGAASAVVATEAGVCAVAGAHDARGPLAQLIAGNRVDSPASVAGAAHGLDGEVVLLPIRSAAGAAQGTLAALMRADGHGSVPERELLDWLADYATGLLATADRHEQLVEAAVEARDAAAAAVLVEQAIPTAGSRPRGADLATHRRPGSVGDGGFHSHTATPTGAVFCAGRVSGPVLPTALAINGIVSTTLRAAGRNRAMPVTDILAEVRRQHEACFSGSVEADVVIGRWDESSATVDLAVAGEPLVMHRHGAGVSLIASTAGPVGDGSRRNDAARSAMVQLLPGEAVVVGTSLVLDQSDEARSCIGVDDVRNLIASTAGCDAEATIDRLVAVFDRHAAAPAIPGDLTILALTRA